MGYDYFALLSIPSDIKLSDKNIEKIIKTCPKIIPFFIDFELDEIKKKLKQKDIKSYSERDFLFGHVYHTSTGYPNAMMLKNYDRFIKKLYEKTHIEKFDIYISYDDYEFLEKKEYIKDKLDKTYHISCSFFASSGKQINDNLKTLKTRYHMESLIINRNITIFTNKNYVWEFKE